jgi:uncharacterized protein (DUF2336 family)
MLVRQFIAQYVGAQPFQPPAERGRAAAAIAGALVRGELPQDEEDDAEVALAAVLDDPSPLVRAALARELSVACNAPYHIIVALANDQADVAAPVLNRSPRLTDTDLIDCVAACEPASQIAVATRQRLSPAVAAALAEVGAREAVLALLRNPSAPAPAFSLRRMVERFGEDGETREALLSRDDLPPAVRAQLVDAAAVALSRFATQCGWLSEERARRAAREAREKAIVQIAADASASASANAASGSAGEDEAPGALALARYLRAQGQLTAGLVLRALLSGERGLLEAALAELSGLPLARVCGLVRDGRGPGFAALFARAGMPAGLLPAFRAALAAQADLGVEIGADPEAGARLSRLMIERVLTSCERLDDSALAPVLALLRRFDAEAAREDARERLGTAPAPRALRLAPGEKPRPMSVAELRSLFRKALAA